MDDADRYGVEQALRFVEASGGGSVIAIAMAPMETAGPLRTALAMGADSAVQVVDDALAGSDSLVTAKILAAVIQRSSYDLVIAGTESN